MHGWWHCILFESNRRNSFVWEQWRTWFKAKHISILRWLVTSVSNPFTSLRWTLQGLWWSRSTSMKEQTKRKEECPKRLEKNWYILRHFSSYSRIIAFEFETEPTSAASYTEIITEQYPSWWSQAVKANYQFSGIPSRITRFRLCKRYTTRESKPAGYHKHIMNIP